VDAAPAQPRTQPAGTNAPEIAGSAADGLREFRQLLASSQIRKWPMYLRNVKQVMRQTNPAFDERAYGFGNLTDLLRAAGREGIVRVDRDRQGVIRVFQGNVSSAPTNGSSSAESQPMADRDDVEDVSVAAAASELGVPVASAVDDVDEVDEIEEVEQAESPADVVAATVVEEPAVTPPTKKAPRARGGRGRARSSAGASDRQPRPRRARKDR
jgi:hypothetical protein